MTSLTGRTGPGRRERCFLQVLLLVINGGTRVAAGRWLDGSGSGVGSWRGANAKVAARVGIISLRCRVKWIHTLKIEADCEKL